MQAASIYYHSLILFLIIHWASLMYCASYSFCMLICVSLSEIHKPPVGHRKITVALFIYLWVHLFIQQTRKKAHNILEDRNQLLCSPGSISKVKCTANRFRASLESGAIWQVSSMINEKSGLILGLIDCVSHLLDMGFLVLYTTSIDSRSY